MTLLVLPALAFRLLIPAGFMPGAGDGYALTMQMCRGDGRSGEVIRVVAQDPEPAGRDTAHEAPCVFAASGTPAPAPAPAFVLVREVSVAPCERPRVATAPLLAPHRKQSPRAPPLMV